MPTNIDDFDQHRIDLAKPLLILRAERGLLACGYLNIATFNKTGEAAAIVTGVNDYEDMLAAPVVTVSESAAAMGVSIGETGASALNKMHASASA